MTNDSKLLLDLWESVRDLLPANKRDNAILTFLRLFEEYGFEISETDLEGEDNYLDDALEIYKDDLLEEDDEVEEDY